MSPRPSGPPPKRGGKSVGAKRGTPQARGRGPAHGNTRGGEPKQQRERSGATTSAHSLGGDQVEGRRAVLELLLAGRRKVREVWVAQGVEESELIEQIVSLCAEERVTIREVPRARLDSVAKSDAPQGVLAMASPIPETDLEEMCAMQGDIKPFLLAFDGVTDPHNLGSLIRTGECSGITGVVLPRHRAVHITPTVAKASAGAVEHVLMTLVAGLPSALTTMKEAGVWTVGLDMDGDTDIHDLAVADQPVVLVFGAEGAGLSRLTKQRCDVLARIPQYGSVASLNVAAAGAVACFEVARRRALTGL